METHCCCCPGYRPWMGWWMHRFEWIYTHKRNYNCKN